MIKPQDKIMISEDCPPLYVSQIYGLYRYIYHNYFELDTLNEGTRLEQIINNCSLKDIVPKFIDWQVLQVLKESEDLIFLARKTDARKNDDCLYTVKQAVYPYEVRLDTIIMDTKRVKYYLLPVSYIVIEYQCIAIGHEIISRFDLMDLES